MIKVYRQSKYIMTFSVHQVELVTIRRVFEEAGFQCGSWEPVHCDDLLAMLMLIYQDSTNGHKSLEDPQILADLTLNLIQNLFDG